MKATDSIKLKFLGAAGTVTGSKSLIEIGKTRILIDCGLFQGLKYYRKMNRAEFPVDPSTIDAIILTHAHLDHILAAGELKKATGAEIHLHQEDKMLWDMVEQQCARFNVPTVTLPDPDHWIQDDSQLSCCSGVAIHTPGHTPGSVSFWFESQKLLVAGDTLFKRSVGRTDFPGGDFDTIENGR